MSTENQTASPNKLVMSPEFAKSMVETFANERWMSDIDNIQKLKGLLPSTWTHMSNLNGIQIGYHMKLLGIEWRNNEEFARVMMFLEKIGLLERKDVFQIRSNPNFVFKKELLD